MININFTMDFIKLTVVGKNVLVFMLMKVHASAKVPIPRMKEKKNTLS